MSTKPLQSIFLCRCAALVLASAVPLAASAQSRCDDPQGSIDLRACAKANEGPTALRRFVERTRMIYGLYFWDYAPRRGAWRDSDGSASAHLQRSGALARLNKRK